MTLHVLMTLMLMTSTADARDPEASPTLRSINATAARLITDGLERSPTLAALVDRNTGRFVVTQRRYSWLEPQRIDLDGLRVESPSPRERQQVPGEVWPVQGRAKRRVD